MSKYVKEIDRGWKNIKKNLKLMNNSEVKVGILSDAPSPKKSKMNMAKLGTIHEFGTKIKVTPKMRGYLSGELGLNLKKSTNEINIPSRPFMRSSFDSNLRNLNNYIEREKTNILFNKMTTKMALDRIGVYFTGKIKLTFRNNDFERNHPITLKNKKSSKPLIDSGRLRQSINHEVDIK